MGNILYLTNRKKCWKEKFLEFFSFLPFSSKSKKVDFFPTPFFVWSFWRNIGGNPIFVPLDWQLLKNGGKFWAIVALIYKCFIYVVAHYNGRRNGANFKESKSLPTSTTNLKFNIFFYFNNKIHPNSTINTIINIRSTPNSTTKENQHQQKFLFSSTTICLTTNIVHQLQQQNTFNNRTIARWRYLTTTTRIHFSFALLFKFVNPAED